MRMEILQKKPKRSSVRGNFSQKLQWLMFTTTEIDIFLPINEGLTRKFAYSDGRVLNSAAHFVRCAQGISLRSYIRNYTYFPGRQNATRSYLKYLWYTNRIEQENKSEKISTFMAHSFVYKWNNSTVISVTFFTFNCSTVATTQRNHYLEHNIFKFFCTIVHVGWKRVSICAS